ncbi:gliding motility-associated C-terminal domain-containing protein [Zunongwangia sp.]|uniref:gliding motility-associated C-terminal domain-containing protein n=1 Tax=Zunongwangia sp. TaxID=1965325 RepID=UPI003AA829B2
MQNFTLRLTGMKIFLFSFVLLMGSLSMRGQEDGCPTADGTNSTQEFCYLQRVSDLLTDGNAIYRTNDTNDPNYNNPIPQDELLMDGVYYAGNSEGTCSERIAINVTVNTSPAPTSGFGPNYSPYLDSPSDTYTVADLENAMNGTDGYEIVVYSTEFGTEELPDNEVLIENQNYFVGEIAENECPSQRVAIAYTPTYVIAPSGEATQSFCASETPTVADLEATSTYENFQAFRWYSTENSNPNLDESTVLQDGETYYASQIVNDRDDPNPPTESKERFAVTVTVIPENFAGADNSVVFCSNSAAVNLLDYVSDDADQNGTFTINDETIAGGNFDPSAYEIGEYTATYTVTNQCGEDSAIISISINEQLDAPTVANQSFCASNTPTVADIVAPENVIFYSDESLENELTPDQTLTSGTYYAVVKNGGCDSEATSFEITVDEQPAAPVVENQTFCETNTPTVADIEPTENVTFYSDSNLENELADDQVLTSGTYYAVATNGTCTSETTSFEISITEQATAPVIADQAFCETNTPTVADIEAPENVTFYSDSNLENELTSDQTLTSGTYYGVQLSDGCDSETATFNITVDPVANAGDDTPITLCESDGVANLNDYILNGQDGGEFTLDGTVLENGSFDPSNRTEDQYNVIYTVTNECGNDEAIFTINIARQPDAPVVEDQSFCANTNPTVANIAADEDVMFYTDENLQNQLAETDQLTNEGTTTTYYAARGEACLSEATPFDITIIASANAGSDVNQPECLEDGTATLDLSSILANADGGGTFTLDGNTVAESYTFTEVGTFEFTYTVTNECGDDSATITIETSNTPEVPQVVDQEFCASDAPTVTDLVLPEGDIQIYADEDGTTALAATDALQSGTYYANQQAGTCISEFDSFVITVNDPDEPTIDAASLELCEYNSYTIADLTAAITSTDEVIWYNAATGGDIVAENTPLVNGTTYYAASYDSETGCEGTTRLTFKADFGECPLVYPEGISPNGDGVNDTFKITDLTAKYPNYEMKVFNRWGNLVYKGNASTPDWDGTSNESSLGDDYLPVGVYFYVIEFNDGSTPAKQGKVFLSR